MYLIVSSSHRIPALPFLAKNRKGTTVFTGAITPYPPIGADTETYKLYK